jgi:DNA-binding response OmpR family regulator
VVDDNDEIRNLIAEVLRHEYNIFEASNAKSAIEIIANNNIHAIVSDILMPGMNGLDLCKSIKENMHTCHIPVVLLTAKGDIEHRIEGIESGADSYIPKPFNPRHLKMRIRMLIQARIQFQKAFQEWIVKGTFESKGLNSRDTKFLEMLQSFVDNNTHKFDLDADQLAAHLAMSKTQLYRKVKAVTGYTPHGFIKNYRLKKSANLILASDMTVSEIIYETGFNNRTYFYKSFKELFGVTPTEYVKQKKYAPQNYQ